MSRLFLTAVAFSLITVGLLAFVLAARAGFFNLEHAQVERLYTRESSQFVTLDGVRIHYTDQGRGETIVLLHGSYLDLTIWDDWAAVLAGHMRVLRPDRSPFGLSSLDPTGNYGYERETDLLQQLLEEVGAGRIVLVGTSSAGIVAARFAALYPERVSRLILINFPLSRGDIRPRWSYRSVRWLRDSVLLHYQPTFITRRYIIENTVTPLPRSSPLVERLTAQANRAGVLAAQRALERGAGAYSAESRLADMRAIQAPTLLIWGQQNPLLTVASGRSALEAVGAPDKSMLVIDNASHMIPIDSSRETLEAVQAFLKASTTSPAARSPD